MEFFHSGYSLLVWTASLRASVTSQRYLLTDNLSGSRNYFITHNYYIHSLALVVSSISMLHIKATRSTQFQATVFLLGQALSLHWLLVLLKELCRCHGNWPRLREAGWVLVNEAFELFSAVHWRIICPPYMSHSIRLLKWGIYFFLIKKIFLYHFCPEWGEKPQHLQRLQILIFD